MPNNESQSPSSRKMIAMIIVLLIAILTIVYLFFSSNQNDAEIILGTNTLNNISADNSSLNVGQIIDTTTGDKFELKNGFLYKVKIDNFSRDGAEGMTRLNGIVTLIKGGFKGDVAIIQIASLSQSLARAEIVEVLERSTRYNPPASVDISLPVTEKILQGTIEALGSKGDGIVKINNKVVFIPNTKIGQKIAFIITSDKGKYAQGKIVENVVTNKTEKPEVKVKVGQEYEVTITQADRYDAANGVTRIDGLVILIPKCKVGDKLKVRITKVAPRFARAIILEKL